MPRKKSMASKKKKAIKLDFGRLYVQTSTNNTIVTLTDNNGNKVLGGGVGLIGFKGTKKSTPYAAELLAKDILKEARDNYGLKEVGLYVKGFGLGREGVFKGINDLGGIDILFITEQTSIQFGGCKGKRPKRN